MNIIRVIEKSDNKYKSFKQLHKEEDVFNRFKVKCKCSHTIIIPKTCDRVICSHCGYWVYKDKKTEIRYKLKEIMKDEKN